MTTDPTRAQADEAPRQRANREAERLAQQLEQAAALLRHLGAMHGGLAADAQPLEAKGPANMILVPRDLLQRVAAYGMPGTRDIDQAALQALIASTEITK